MYQNNPNKSENVYSCIQYDIELIFFIFCGFTHHLCRHYQHTNDEIYII